ncbi:hypothetical protein WJX82_004094 [Trebouxia sp. C0006]
METSLAAAEEAADGDKVRFLRNRLEQLDRKEVMLREEKNKLMDIQSGGLFTRSLKVFGKRQWTSMRVAF